MTLTEVPRPAYFTAAWDLAGVLKIQQIQYRMVLDRDGVPDRELELLPIQFIKAPLENDPITAKIAEALDAVAAGSLARIAELEAERDGLAEQVSTLQDAHDRLRIVVDGLSATDSAIGTTETASATAADSGGG